MKGTIDQVVEDAKSQQLMAHAEFGVEVLTPEGEVFNGEIEVLSTRTTISEVGVLANHAPLLRNAQAGRPSPSSERNRVKHYAQGEGYLQVFGNRALVLVPRRASSRSGSTRRRNVSALRKAEEVLARIDQEALTQRVRKKHAHRRRSATRPAR